VEERVGERRRKRWRKGWKWEEEYEERNGKMEKERRKMDGGRGE